MIGRAACAVGHCNEFDVFRFFFRRSFLIMGVDIVDIKTVLALSPSRPILLVASSD